MQTTDYVEALEIKPWPCRTHGSARTTHKEGGVEGAPSYPLHPWHHCNDPKPLCKDHHGFGVFLKLFLVVVFRQTVC
jgi:hypothetical protein